MLKEKMLQAKQTGSSLRAPWQMEKSSGGASGLIPKILWRFFFTLKHV